MSTFLVDLDTPGLAVHDGYRNVSHRGYTNSILDFDDVRVRRRRAARRGGQGASSWPAPGSARPGSRSPRPASAAPSGRSTSRSGTPPSREQFGQPIGRFQGVGFKLADMATELRAAELMTLHAAWKYDQGTATDADIAMAKLKATEMLAMVADEAIQIHGGMGLMDELPAGADLARRPHRADLGRHLGDPAAHHQPVAAAAAGSLSDDRERRCRPGSRTASSRSPSTGRKANAIDLATSREMGQVFAAFRDDPDAAGGDRAHRGRQVLLRGLGPQGRGRRRRGRRRLRRRRLRRAPGAARPQQAGDRGRARPGDGRRLRAGPVVRPDLRLGGHPVRPARDQRRHPRRRGDDQAAQADARTTSPWSCS